MINKVIQFLQRLRLLKKAPEESSEKTDAVSPRASLTDSLHALEPRFMFDAAGVATGNEVTADSVAQDQAEAAFDSHDTTADHADLVVPAFVKDTEELFSALAVIQPSDTSNEIIFIDRSVENYESLLSGINSTAEVIFIESDSDGVEQITNVLASRTNINAIHIIAHGDAGNLALGDASLTNSSMQAQHADDLAIIKNALSDNADILIYGCNFAEGDSGKTAADTLSALTGADIAASIDLTVHETLGGDWILEYQIGDVGTISIEAQNWVGALTTTLDWSTHSGNAAFPLDSGTETVNILDGVGNSISIDVTVNVNADGGSGGLGTTVVAGTSGAISNANRGNIADHQLVMAAINANSNMTDTQTYEIDFNQQVYGLSWTFTDIDTDGGTGFQDQVLIQAYDASNNIVDFTAANVSLVSGATVSFNDGTNTLTAVTGQASVAANSNLGNATVTFGATTGVTRVVFTYGQGVAGTGAANQALGIYNMTFSEAPNAVNDTNTVNEDTTVSTTAFTGVLLNDTESNEEVAATSVVDMTAALTRNYDAGLDTVGGVWENEVSPGTADWTLGTGVTLNSTPVTNHVGITKSFTFDGTNGATSTNFTEAQSEADASFEFWIKPATGLANRSYLIFETGAANQGIALVYDKTNNEIEFYYNDHDSTGVATLVYDLDTSGIDPTAEFIQVAITLGATDGGSTDNNTIRLYINGSQVATTTISSGGNNLDDWADTNATGLGRINGTSVAPGGVLNFNGEIAIARAYGDVLTASEVTNNYHGVAGSRVTGISDPVNSNVGTIGSSFALASGATVTLNANGSYTYNTNGAFNSLHFGQSTVDNFSYTITDARGITDTAIVAVTVTGRDDITFGISRDNASISEDSAGTVTYTIAVGGRVSATNTASVDLVATGGAISGTDYNNFIAAIDAALVTGVSRSGNTLTFTNAFNGNTGTGNFVFSVSAINDQAIKGTETIIATLSNATTDSAKGNVSIGTSSVSTNITEIDQTVNLALSRNLASISEEGLGSVDFTITLSQALSTGNSISVDISDVAGGAASGTDTDALIAAIDADLVAGVTRSGNTLTFSQAGGFVGTSFTFNLTATNDALVEGTEALALQLSNLAISVIPDCGVFMSD